MVAHQYVVIVFKRRVFNTFIPLLLAPLVKDFTVWSCTNDGTSLFPVFLSKGKVRMHNRRSNELKKDRVSFLLRKSEPWR